MKTRRSKTGRVKVNHSKAALYAAKRRVKRRKRNKLARHISNQGNSSDYNETNLLNGLYRSRSTKWKQSSPNSKPYILNLKHFCLIDYPKKTLNSIVDLIKHESRGVPIIINFLDNYCLDISPYILLSLVMKDFSRDTIKGGRIHDSLKKVLVATGIADYMDMADSNADLPMTNLWPIKIKKCIQSPGEAANKTGASGVYAFEFTGAINNWLNHLDYELTQKGEEKITQSLCEILDNALIHGSSEDEIGEAWLSGFMAKRSNGNKMEYICHIGVLNTGPSISQTLKGCRQDLKNEIAKLTEKHKSSFRLIKHRWDEQCLWTLYALQDKVTCITDTSFEGGKGLMDFIQILGEIGGSYDSLNEGVDDPKSLRVAIISGPSYILVPGIKPNINSEKLRNLALNTSNDITAAPDNRLVRKLATPFPGTVLSARFHLDQTYLQAKSF